MGLTINASFMSTNTVFGLHQKYEKKKIKQPEIMLKNDDELTKEEKKLKKQATMEYQRDMHIEELKEKAVEARKNRVIDKIEEKMLKGQPLTPEEENYFRTKQPERFEETKRVVDEAKMYEKMVKNARTEREAEQAIITAKNRVVQSLKSGGKMISYGKKLKIAVEEIEKKFIEGKYHKRDGKGGLEPKPQKEDKQYISFSISI